MRHRSPTRTSTRAGSAATGARRRSTSPRTGASGRRCFTEHERRAALWNYAMFFHGEDAVADDLAPFIDAAPREEQKYFLATQQVDEARHAIFFKRFMHEVVGRGDGTVAGGLRATEPELTWGFRKTFALLDEVTGALRTRPLAHRARARGDDVPHHRRGDCSPSPASTSSPTTSSAATCCPASARACSTSRWTSSATSASASSCCTTSRKEDPRGPRGGRRPAARGHAVSRSRCSSRRAGTAPTPSASASRSRRSTPRARARSSPSCARPGLPLESLPGPSVVPARPAGRASAPSAAWRCCAPASSARSNGAPPRDPEAMALLFDSVAPRGRPPHRARRPVHRAVGVPGRRAVAPARRQRLDRGRRRPRARHVDVELRVRLRRLGRRRRRAAGPEAARSPPGGCA